MAAKDLVRVVALALGVAVAPANALLDRGWGKPAQTVTQTIEQRRNVREWSTDELIAYLNETRDSDGAVEEASGHGEPDSVH
jgi:hypothetical protein